MNPAKEKIEEIFCAALELTDPSERMAFLERACTGDANLRSSVEQMLSEQSHVEELFGAEGIAHVSAAGLFQSLNITDLPQEAELILSTREDVGQQVGPYKLLERIGEGGCGVVYVAEQMQPVRRRVALKLIKPGMDTKNVIARFELERQAMALMDHPNIARVLDAGETELGRPYVTMDLVL